MTIVITASLAAVALVQECEAVLGGSHGRPVAALLPLGQAGRQAGRRAFVSRCPLKSALRAALKCSLSLSLQRCLHLGRSTPAALSSFLDCSFSFLLVLGGIWLIKPPSLWLISVLPDNSVLSFSHLLSLS